MKYMRLQGKTPMYNALVKTWWNKLFRMAYTKTADRDQAHDMVQEVFLSVWEKWETVPQGDDVEFYLLHALRYKILNYYRASGRYKIQLQQLDELLNQISDKAEEQHYVDQRLVLAENAVELLPPSLKRVFTLRIQNGYSYDKIGQILDIDPASARVMYSRALDQLRKAVARKPEVAMSLMAILSLVTIS
jgi:RNA polymerase sigma factor (sigma-70 family)